MRMSHHDYTTNAENGKEGQSFRSRGYEQNGRLDADGVCTQGDGARTRKVTILTHGPALILHFAAVQHIVLEAWKPPWFFVGTAAVASPNYN